MKWDGLGISMTAVLVAVAMSLFANVIFLYFARRRLPSAYSIAIIGYPRSGKTCLITAMFGELFSQRIIGIKTVPRGKETIERINRDLANLDIGTALGPTRDQDLFAYRADIRKGSFPFTRVIKTEIGDFPGENSEQFAEQFGEWLHQTAYFKWVMEANAFVFVVDTAAYYVAQDRAAFVAHMSKAIRAAWQHLQEYHIEGHKRLDSKPVALVFTKSDLIARFSTRLQSLHGSVSFQSTDRDQLRRQIETFGYSTIQSPKVASDGSLALDAEILAGIAREFSDIITYLETECRRFRLFHVSSIAKTKGGRLGVASLLRHVLP